MSRAADESRPLAQRVGGPVVTVDVVVLRAFEGRLQVLTIERRREPFAGRRALPGAYVAAGETLIEASIRCLHDKAGVPPAEPGDLLGRPEQFLAADSVARDPRGHAVSIVHLGVASPALSLSGGEAPAWLDVDTTDPRSRASRHADGTSQPAGMPVGDGLAFDHSAVVAAARAVLADRLWRDSAAFVVLAGRQPLTTPLLRSINEAVVGVPLDHANFTRRLVNSGLFAASDEAESAPGGPAAVREATSKRRGRGRPATVWIPS